MSPIPQEVLRPLYEVFVNVWTIATGVGIFALLRKLPMLDWSPAARPLARIHPVLPDFIFEFWRRILPIFPELLGVIAAFLFPFPNIENQHWGLKVMFGLCVGYMAQRFHKLLGQTVLGDDPKLRSRMARRYETTTPWPPNDEEDRE